MIRFVNSHLAKHNTRQSILPLNAPSDFIKFESLGVKQVTSHVINFSPITGMDRKGHLSKAFYQFSLSFVTFKIALGN